MLSSLQAVGFDIDGTLYPELAMYLNSIPLLLRHPLLLKRFGKARKVLRSEAEAGVRSEIPYRLRQAACIAGGESRAAATEVRVEEKIYRFWERSFLKIAPFEGVIELFTALKTRGMKIGLLSDFPLGVKPKALGVEEFTDVFSCAEDSGYLKPAPEPFLLFSEMLNTAPEQILYVGNSYLKDAVGAKKAGMTTALLVSPKSMGNRDQFPAADLLFSSYQELFRQLFPLS